MPDSQRLDIVEQLALLNFAVRLLLSEQDRGLLVERGLEALSDFSGAARLGLFLSRDEPSMKAVGYWRTGYCPTATPVLPLSGSPFEKVVQAKKPLTFPLAGAEGPPYPVFVNGVPERLCLVAPLIEAGNRVIGAATFEFPTGEPPDENRRQSLLMILSVLAISLENVRGLEELRAAHGELKTLNSAKTKMIDHLSHELKTPLAVVGGSVKLLEKDSIRAKPEKYFSILERINRNLDRLKELEEQAGDIAAGKPFLEKSLISSALARSRDLLETMAPEGKIKSADLLSRLDELFGDPGPEQATTLDLCSWVPATLERLSSEFPTRKVRVELELDEGAEATAPEQVLFKSFRGVVRNAVENTPDGQSILIRARREALKTVLEINDYGVGLDRDLQGEVFHGFVHAGATADYSTGRPWEFGAGGRGLDLPRIKVFSEKYGFGFYFSSRPCPHAAEPGCPGDVSACGPVSGPEECRVAGETVFTFEFPLGGRD
ncbi:MAG: sensor histidine kinase [Pseudomonadota bacterium]